MTKVLFVCLGNICRSPLAEGIFADMVAKRGLSNQIICDSAGTANYHVGEQPNEFSIRVANAHGLTLNHTCRQLVPADFLNFDYILTMDEMNYNSAILVRDKTKSAKANLFKIRTFDNEKSGRDVEDPYQRGEKAFEACYQILHQCCHNFLDFLEKKS